MQIIDLHQDLILSYENDISQFQHFNPQTYHDTFTTNAGSLQDYISSSTTLVFAVTWPYKVKGNKLDKANRTIVYDKELQSFYINAYKNLAEQANVSILQTKSEFTFKDTLSFILHLEGCDGIENIDDIAQLSQQGISSFGFVWNFDNNLCSCNVSKDDYGLTTFGHEAVEYLNQQGLLIDTAHMSHRSMMDTVKTSKKPILNSHSNLKHFCSHSRNVEDELLYALAKNGGVLGLSLCQPFISQTSQTNITMYLDQINYVRNLIGDDHIAFGSDYHGLPHKDIIPELGYIKDLPLLQQAITDRCGHDFCEKFFTLNCLRVIQSQ